MDPGASAAEGRTALRYLDAARPHGRVKQSCITRADALLQGTGRNSQCPQPYFPLRRSASMRSLPAPVRERLPRSESPRVLEHDPMWPADVRAAPRPWKAGFCHERPLVSAIPARQGRITQMSCRTLRDGGGAGR
jgi:hypothetical protein